MKKNYCYPYFTDGEMETREIGQIYFCSVEWKLKSLFRGDSKRVMERDWTLKLDRH